MSAKNDILSRYFVISTYFSVANITKCCDISKFFFEKYVFRAENMPEEYEELTKKCEK
jgi:hypothetical protein